MKLSLSGREFSAVIFDFNGVLLLDSAWHEEAWGEMIHELTGQAWSQEEIANCIHGRTNLDILSQVLGRGLARDEFVRLADKKEDIYRAKCALAGSAFALAPGAVALLSRLKSQRIPITIASSSGEKNMRYFFQKLGLEQWFRWDAIIYNDGTLKGKPEPDSYLRAAWRLGVQPGQAIVVEDAIAGMQSARRAGMGMVVAVGQSQTLPEQARALFDMKLANLLDLASVLNFTRSVSPMVNAAPAPISAMQIACDK